MPRNAVWVSLANNILLSGTEIIPKSFFNSHSGGGGLELSPLGTSDLPGVIVLMKNLVERKLAGETEVLGENLP
jgi:hypothetical protein